MVDTRRSRTEIATLLADNGAGAISAQDLRDAFETMQSDHGEIAIDTPVETVITDSVTFFEAAGTYALGSPAMDWDMDVNGRLRYIGVPDRVADIQGSFSVTAATNNQVLHFALAKNGVAITAGEVKRKIGTGSDVGSGFVHGLTTVSTNDYLTLTVQNESSTANVTFETLEISAWGSIL